MKIGILRFLGTNCDYDIWEYAKTLGHECEWLWYKDHFDPKGYDRIIIPGGFSYGDYLRSGALASRTPVMDSVKQAAQNNVPILGICNGFQILCEIGLLPGALLANDQRRFIDKWVDLEVVNDSESWNWGEKNVRMPIAHGEGRYFIDEQGLKQLEEHGGVWMRYKDNPNGSVADIAGVTQGNVAGLMPHPERAIYEWMGGTDGLKLLRES